ncbi:unnamed protein product [Phytophthora fragariaefolia]|uniref:Unnamed protein product n=1 Tax=Phytophthora fragariaefolia TaxID=1490495 RepID=A0A9W6YHA1_9STRA|nr:unnamed protein product [Phytophthora fragariaefolia]
MANGYLSEKMPVTSGIRQGCPLAPLLFIIAVDLLYDAVEGDEDLTGIELGGYSGVRMLKVAGYADDTAIYISSHALQRTAIRTLSMFSAVSGLQLSIRKSVALNLVEEAADDDSGDDRKSGADMMEQKGDVVVSAASTRYFGHIAGSGNTVLEAWEKAFAALRVGLVLTEDKPNTAQQRAAIATAIIIPKLMYVARHAWPTKDIVQRADRSIRNYVWHSAFSAPERAPVGWVTRQVAERSIRKGGIGMPNIVTELKALSAMVVGSWALSTVPQAQRIGDVLQHRDIGMANYLVPMERKPSKGLQPTLWGTG